MEGEEEGKENGIRGEGHRVRTVKKGGKGREKDGGGGGCFGGKEGACNRINTIATNALHRFVCKLGGAFANKIFCNRCSEPRKQRLLYVIAIRIKTGSNAKSKRGSAGRF